MVLSRKGQDAGPVSAFIFILALLIVLYVLFIPEDARNELIDFDRPGGGSGSRSSADGSGGTTETVILSESPGRITPQGRNTFDYLIDSFTIFAETDAAVIKQENPFLIKNGWFTKQPRNTTFIIESLDLADNIVASFNTPQREGVLSIALNGKNIVQQRVSNYNPAPIALPKAELIEGENTLTFSTSSVGIGFWGVNEYQIENLQIIADITDISRQEAENIFFIPESREGIEESELKFVPECTITGVGTLHVLINDRRVFSGVPECGRLNTFTVPPQYLRENTNTIIFTTERGNYLLDRIKITTDMKEKQFPTYYFNLDEDVYSYLDDEFDDLDRARLEVQVEVNGQALRGARVEVENGEDKTDLTDGDGEATFLLKAGRYDVEVDFDDAREEKTVILSPGEDAFLQFDLDEDDIDDLDEDEGVLKVVVIDEDSDAVEGARVEVEIPNDSDEVKRTDTDGEATFVIDPATVVVDISKGDENERRTVTISAGERESVRVRLNDDFGDSSAGRVTEKLFLRIHFVEPDNFETIEMKVQINNNDIGIFQRKETYLRDITEFLRAGNNVLKLIPEEPVDIVEVEVVEEIDE